VRRAAVAIGVVLAIGLIAAGCSGGAGVTRKAGAATERPAAPDTERAAAGRSEGPVTQLAVADYSDSLSGEPGGMATDRGGAIVEVDDNTVVAFDRTAAEQWTSSVPGAALGWPLLGNGLVVVPTLSAAHLGESSGHSFSGADDSGGCVALDRATGTRRWSYEEEGRSGVSVATDGSRVFCVFGDGVIAAVDRDSGALLWRVTVDKRVPSAPVTVSERSMAIVDPASRTLSFTARWGGHWMLITRDLAAGTGEGGMDLGVKGPPSSPVLLAPGEVGLGVDARMCRIDLRRRRLGCAHVTVSDGFDPASVPVVADGVLVIASRTGDVLAIEIKPWKLIWSERLPGAILDARPVISDGVVLFADFARNPWAFRMADGSKVAVPTPEGFVIATATDPVGGFAVAVRADIDQRVERWVPRR
jgi:outer membrane protein assembly factor BamB